MDLEKLFEQINSELLTPEVKVQLSAIFESKLNEAIKAKEQELETQNKTEITEFKENLINQVDEYLNYFTEEYASENQEQIAESVKVSAAKKVLITLDKLVEEFNIELSDEKIGDDKELTDLKTKLNTKENENISLKKTLSEAKRLVILDSIASQFEITSQREKFETLAENLSYEDEKSFTAKAQAIAKTVKGLATIQPTKIVDTEDKIDEIIIETHGKKETQELRESDKSMTSYLDRL